MPTGSSGCQLPPLWAATQPCAGKNLRRRLSWALLHFRTPFGAARSGLHLPSLAIGAYVYVTTPAQGPVSVPPVALDPHPLTV